MVEPPPDNYYYYHTREEKESSYRGGVDDSQQQPPYYYNNDDDYHVSFRGTILLFLVSSFYIDSLDASKVWFRRIIFLYSPTGSTLLFFQCMS